MNNSKKYYLLAGIALVNLINAGMVSAEETPTTPSTDQVIQTQTSIPVADSTRKVAENNSSSNPVSEVVITNPDTSEINENSVATRQDNLAVTKPESVMSSQTSTAVTQKPVVSYESHVQNIGWQAPVVEDATSGTTGQSKRIEAIKINIDSLLAGGVEYASNVATIGWQGYVYEGQVFGTTGLSKAIEAIKINLNGDLATAYDIYYRTQIAKFGWLGWAKNGEVSGSQNLSLRAEAFEIKLFKKGEVVTLPTTNTFISITKPLLSYQTHVQNIGWQAHVAEGQLAGTTGQSKRVEAIEMFLSSTQFGDIEYRAQVQGIGWQNYVSTSEIAGKVGQSKRLEAINMSLTGYLAQKYSIKYRVHVQGTGW